jgi:Malectin domain
LAYGFSVGLYSPSAAAGLKTRIAQFVGADLQSAVNKLEAERAELDSILASEILGRSNNLVRLLSFVCERYFDGAIDEIKEYSIAVQALGRTADFDPQLDTIVRVTAHALRKRLEEYYRTVGANHSVHISLPPGHYVPKFVHKGDLESGTQADLREPPRRQNGELIRESGFRADEHQEIAPSLQERTAASARKPRLRFASRHRIVAAMVLVVVVLLGFIWYARIRTNDSRSRLLTVAPAIPAAVSGQIVRAMAGEGRAPYIDRAGAMWESDRFCSGGDSFSVRDHAIQGTEDPQLFSGGRRGTFRCILPVAPGIYEIHLLFAETAGLLENSRNVGFSINRGPVMTLDVVDDAGGDDIATTKVFTDVKPEDDGAIHLDFTTSDSFLNAIEILPGTPHRMLPVRIVSGPSQYRDSNGNTWLPDRYFFGGRVNRFGRDLSKIPEGRLFEWHRYGHFHYTVPVAAGQRYTLKLYFLEHWFGVQNGSVGGEGSRVFDVSCNGSMLLKGFDIFREAGGAPLTKTFTHIEPTPQGKIEIYFTPNLNYPSVSAVEIMAE